MIRIVLLLSFPVLSITGLFSFMVAWSEFVIASDGKYAYTSFGSAIITMLPVVIMFMGLSKFIVGGLTVGGVKE
jgi:arabinogalactan oligomer/maltooligosaccharide transport system permease protein